MRIGFLVRFVRCISFVRLNGTGGGGGVPVNRSRFLFAQKNGRELDMLALMCVCECVYSMMCDLIINH